MKLYVLRHGIAADVGPAGMGDAGRPLTQEGIEKMEAEARGLARLGVRVEVLLSSPLVRARQTAEIVARELRVEVQLADVLAFGTDTRELLDLLGQHHRAESVMVVGHTVTRNLSVMLPDGSGTVMKSTPSSFLSTSVSPAVAPSTTTTTDGPVGSRCPNRSNSVRSASRDAGPSFCTNEMTDPSLPNRPSGSGGHRSSLASSHSG